MYISVSAQVIERHILPVKHCGIQVKHESNAVLCKMFSDLSLTSTDFTECFSSTTSILFSSADKFSFCTNFNFITTLLRELCNHSWRTTLILISRNTFGPLKLSRQKYFELKTTQKWKVRRMKYTSSPKTQTQLS